MYKNNVQNYNIADWAWKRETLFPSTGVRPRTVQPIASHCTDYTILALKIKGRETGYFMYRLALLCIQYLQYRFIVG
jgi:hypothetical protein